MTDKIRIVTPDPSVSIDDVLVCPFCERGPSECECDQEDEEMVTHSFDARTAGNDECWCTGCEYHRDHPIHRKASAPVVVQDAPVGHK